MARASKVTPEQWAQLRKAWESDSRAGFTWLVSENNVGVSPQAVRKRSVAEGWTKVTEAVKVTPKVTEEPREELSEELSVTKAEKDDEEPAEEVKELSEKEKLFVAEYAKDFNGTQAAIRAGYSKRSAESTSYRLLRKEGVRQEVKRVVTERCDAAGIDAEKMLREWAERMAVDSTSVAKLKRIPCRFCYSTDGKPQYTYATYFAEKEKHDKLRAALLKGEDSVDIGEFPTADQVEFVDMRKKPNPDCPACGGFGIERLFLADSDDLPKESRKLIERYTRDGGEYNVTFKSREKTEENIAKAIGMFREKEEAKVEVTINLSELSKVFEERMRLAREKTEAVFTRRGIPIEDLTELDVNG